MSKILECADLSALFNGDCELAAIEISNRHQRLIERAMNRYYPLRQVPDLPR
jgi:hypothetical protein